MRRLIESLKPGDYPIAWTWIGAMFAFYVVVMSAAVAFYVGHQPRGNLAQKTGAAVATGSAPAAQETGMLRSLQHVVHHQEDARVICSE